MEQGQKPVRAYEPTPKQQHPSSAALYERYQTERQAYQLKREPRTAIDRQGRFQGVAKAFDAEDGQDANPKQEEEESQEDRRDA